MKQKAKETKEISMKNLTGYYNDIVCDFALCTFYF